jgi:hypothetical protein
MFTVHVTEVAAQLRDAGVISDAQYGMLVSAAARSGD